MFFINTNNVVYLFYSWSNPFYACGLVFSISVCAIAQNIYSEILHLYIKPFFIFIFFINAKIKSCFLVFVYWKRSIFFNTYLQKNLFIEINFFLELVILFFIFSMLLFLIYSSKSSQLKTKLFNYQFVLIVLFIVLGCLMLQTNNFFFLICCFIGTNLIVYCLLFLNKLKFNSQEPVLKYFYLSTITTLLMAYCFWIFLEIFNTENYFDIFYVLFLINKNNEFMELFYISLVLLLSSIMFKLGGFPMHVWTPEIYFSSSYCFIYFFSVPIKIIFVVITLNWVNNVFVLFFLFCSYLLTYYAAFSVIFGALGALYERNWKMFFAYSSINQMGFILSGLSCLNTASVINVFYFLLIYCFTAGLFISSLLILNNKKKLYIYIDHVVFFKNNNTLDLIIISACLFSFAGIPIFAGFYTKYTICQELYFIQSLLLLTIALVISVISTYYYIYIVKTFFFNENYQQFVHTISGFFVPYSSGFIFFNILFLSFYSKIFLFTLKFVLHF